MKNDTLLLMNNCWENVMVFLTVRNRVRNGFTLVELLVVITIISILAGLMLPALAKAKAAAQQTACVSNHKQLSIAILSYTDNYDNWLPAHGGLAAGGGTGIEPGNYVSAGLGNWINKLLPMVGLKPGWESPVESDSANPQRWGRGIFHCPVKGAELGVSGTRWYGGMVINQYVVGKNMLTDGFSYVYPPRRMRSIKAPSVLVLAGDGVDASVAYNPWTPWKMGYTLGDPHEIYAGRHNGRGNYLWCDLHVAAVSAGDMYTNRADNLLPK